ncbi:glycosyltransferase family 2 protein [Agromyces silvae]|uniref:glycosyltransferase family 2 protein n=1 Tax=Agromyces silvae TaxID=3388266 RepID=UPI00280C0265|nr:glycosyltransferase family 2 protein [Agromyces protaetiae]
MTDASAGSPAASDTTSVSVALGTHNGARYLAAQLESVLAQTYPVREIVVSDDASSDDTVALAERLVAEHRSAGRHIELVVMRNAPALGVTANFEQALRATSGDLVALSDQDDVWRVDRVERAVRAFAARPQLQLVASNARLVDERGDELPASLFETLGITAGVLARISAGGAPAELLKRNLFTGATMMLRRTLVQRAVPFPASWVHDEWLAIVASLTGGVGVVDEPLIDYRQHGANQIGVTELGLGGKLGRLRAPRTERNMRLLARARDLATRLPGLIPDDAWALRQAAEKLAHESARSALPPGRLGRVAPVMRELRTGRYSAFGRGAQDVLRDLVQPV